MGLQSGIGLGTGETAVMHERSYGTPVDTIAQMRALGPADRPDNQWRALNDQDSFYEFEPASVAADDGNLILRPDDIGPGAPGRWERRTGAGIAPVTSVFGRLGAVVAAANDYTHAQLAAVGPNDHHAQAHAADHTNGTDDIQTATIGQQGLASAAQIITLTANELYRTNDMPFFNGSILETIDPTVSSDGATITFALQRQGGGNLTVQLSVANLTYAAGNVGLTAGADDENPQLNFVYIEDVAGTATLVVSTVGWPVTEHAPVAVVLCQTATGVAADGPYKMHAWTDHAAQTSGQGHLSDVNRRLREQNAEWTSGVVPTLTIGPLGGAPDTVDIAVTSGVVFQLHPHVMPALDTAGGGGDPIFAVNDSGTLFDRITDLNVLLTDSLGGSMAGRFFSLVIWGAVAEKGGDSKFYVNLPSGSYNTQSRLEEDASKFADFSIPAEFKGVGFLIAELKLRHQAAASGTWTEIDTIDLRGLFPSITAGGSSVQGSQFAESLFGVTQTADPDLAVGFDLTALTVSRTITMPDTDVTLVDSSLIVLTSGANPLTSNWDTGAHEILTVGLQARAAATLTLSDNAGAPAVTIGTVNVLFNKTAAPDSDAGQDLGTSGLAWDTAWVRTIQPNGGQSFRIGDASGDTVMTFADGLGPVIAQIDGIDPTDNTEGLDSRKIGLDTRLWAGAAVTRTGWIRTADVSGEDDQLKFVFSSDDNGGVEADMIEFRLDTNVYIRPSTGNLIFERADGADVLTIGPTVTQFGSHTVQFFNTLQVRDDVPLSSGNGSDFQWIYETVNQTNNTLLWGTQGTEGNTVVFTDKARLTLDHVVGTPGTPTWRWHDGSADASKWGSVTHDGTDLSLVVNAGSLKVTGNIIPEADGTRTIGRSTAAYGTAWVRVVRSDAGNDLSILDGAGGSAAICASAITVLNQGGLNKDLRIEGAGDIQVFTVDAGLDRAGVGVALAAHAAKLDVDQNVVDAAIPVLRLFQTDIDDAFINFGGTSAADSTRSISSSVAEAAAKTGAVLVEVNGVPAWVRTYASAV